MYTLLRNKNKGLKADVIGLAQELVRIPSVSRSEEKVAEVVERAMLAVGYDKVFRDDAGNVVGVIFGREAAPTVLLNSHMDTVPPEEPAAGTQVPKAGSIRAGRLWGLGATDCKGGVAAHVFTGALLKRAMLPLAGNLVVAATVAEENGCSVGVKALIEKTLPELRLTPTYAILGEPTGLGLYYGHDGWIEMEIRVEGANPFQVDDAAQAIADGIIESAPVEGARCEREAMRGPCFEELEGRRRATIFLDKRLGASEEAGDVVSEVAQSVRQATRGCGAVAVEVAVRQERQRLYTGLTTMVRRVAHSWATDPFSPLIERARQSLEAAGCKAQPGKWRLGRLGMGTAGGVLVNEFEIPAIGYGAGDEEVAHTPGEYVDTERLSEMVYGTAVMAHGLVGIPTYGWTADEI
jgi:acetylornithine deacetylase/succinyl-diaminopimelate desuccinylase-like protein